MSAGFIIDIHAHIYRPDQSGREDLDAFDQAPQWGGTPDELRAVMEASGISRTVISGVIPTQAIRQKVLAQLPADASRQTREAAEREIREEVLRRMDQQNSWGCEIGRRSPELLPFITLDPTVMDAITIRRKVRESVTQGARGIALLPSLHGFYGNDRHVWPIYEMAQSFGLPILAQTGDAGSAPPTGRGHWGRPRYFADVAGAFPKLVLILAHLGQGYESEIAVLTRRHPNVYTDTSLRLSHLGDPGKWTPAEAVTWLRLIGVDRILFGTKWPLCDPRQEIATIRDLPLTEEEQRKILGENAKRALRL